MNRWLTAVIGGLVLAAGALWGAAALAGDAPVLRGLALLALAGVGGAVATAGVVRRAVGGLLVLAGAGAVVAGAVVAGAVVAGAGAGWPAVLVAVAGGSLLAAAGGILAVRPGALPGLGVRYDGPAARRGPADPDRTLWEAMDAGEDPTAGR